MREYYQYYLFKVSKEGQIKKKNVVYGETDKLKDEKRKHKQNDVQWQMMTEWKSEKIGTPTEIRRKQNWVTKWGPESGGATE